MRTLRASLLGLFLVVVPMVGTSAAEEKVCTEVAQGFWRTFRENVLKDNVQEVTKQTRFPFEIRGTLDSGEIKRIDRRSFILQFRSLLRTDPGASAEPSTMKDLIMNTLALQSKFCSPNGREFRVGNWAFEATKRDWLFVRAYVED